MSSRRWLLLAFLLVGLGRSVVGQAPLPAPVAQVVMEVRYDPETGGLTGTERLRWHNTSRASVPDLRFHLYLNAFANTSSTFMRERGSLRGRSLPEGRWGWIEVASMTLADGTDLKKAERFLAEDDGNAEDRTVASYPLPRPLPPGEWLEVEIRFTAQLPGVAARTGKAGDFVLAGQWFPKVAVFEDAGVRGRAVAGWSCHQFHADSEFYADFADWDVTVELPARYRGQVFATGRLVEVASRGPLVRSRFLQKGVHDFVWTADPRYVVIKDRFRPEYDTPPGLRGRVAALLGVEPGLLALRPVDITLLLQPADLPQGRRYMQAAKRTLAELGLRLGAYPWDTLTMVDPPRDAWGAGGMEYQTFITLGTHPLLDLPGLEGVAFPETVTVHEVAHNFWQGAVANDEAEEAWLDEGLASYFESVVMDDWAADEPGRFSEAGSYADSNRRILARLPYDPIVWPSWRYRSEASYANAVYRRAALSLGQLERSVGSEVFHRAVRRFATEWRFRHPGTADFERAMAAATELDLTPFFRQALHGTAVLDYAVTEATTRAEGEGEGVFWEAGKRRLVEPPSEADATGTGVPPRRYRSEVLVERRGDFVHPVTVELGFADGVRERRDWDGRDRWVRLEALRPVQLEWAEVDPDHVLALDRNLLNNSLRVAPRAAPKARALDELLLLLQSLMTLAVVLG